MLLSAQLRKDICTTYQDERQLKHALKHKIS
jgi:hypothetical protein